MSEIEMLRLRWQLAAGQASEATRAYWEGMLRHPVTGLASLKTSDRMYAAYMRGEWGVA